MADLDIKKEILGFFRDTEGGFVSGEDISDALGFSRAGVWKHISKLRKDGYVIEAVPHHGYRLSSSPDKLYGYEISAGLDTGTMGRKAIYHYETIPTTNDKAYELAEKGSEEGTIIIAETQTKGKGRMGRTWTSPKGQGIYMSMILRPDVETDEIPAITLVAAAAVIAAVKKTSGLEPGTKWPNDVMIEGKKLCGILTEIKAQPDKVDFLILGIGINVNTPAGKLPLEGTALKEKCGRRLSRLELIRQILREFEKRYDILQKKGFAALRDECKKVSLVLKKEIRVEEHHKTIKGVAVDIDEKGVLIVKTAKDGLKRIFSGDVVLCRPGKGR
ncbi:MAG: biotin--[acetyl-CoA-carboxylase] ligase [Candidatus Tantalella remota]|nr:biotin--[acetyl-CoA-carboxylase] ligase [Candidatus Tantalella remota]